MQLESHQGGRPCDTSTVFFLGWNSLRSFPGGTGEVYIMVGPLKKCLRSWADIYVRETGGKGRTEAYRSHVENSNSRDVRDQPHGQD
jgi:hypothetical protein